MENLDVTSIVAFICGILFPAYVFATGKKSIRLLEQDPGKLTFIYKETGILLILMTLLVVASMIIDQVSFRIIGLGFISEPLWIFLLFVASLISYKLIQKINIPSSKMDSVGKGLEGVQHVLPKTNVEYRLAITISFIAGVCEEIIFRGFLYWRLSLLVPMVPAVLIVNLLFGVAHATTKLNNAIKAFGLGVFFSITYILTDSLWVAILTHIIIDLYAAAISFKFAQLKASA